MLVIYNSTPVGSSRSFLQHWILCGNYNELQQRIILVASKFLQVKSPNIRELQNLFV